MDTTSCSMAQDRQLRGRYFATLTGIVGRDNFHGVQVPHPEGSTQYWPIGGLEGGSRQEVVTGYHAAPLVIHRNAMGVKGRLGWGVCGVLPCNGRSRVQVGQPCCYNGRRVEAWFAIAEDLLSL